MSDTKLGVIDGVGNLKENKKNNWGRENGLVNKVIRDTVLLIFGRDAEYFNNLVEELKNERKKADDYNDKIAA